MLVGRRLVPAFPNYLSQAQSPSSSELQSLGLVLGFTSSLRQGLGCTERWPTQNHLFRRFSLGQVASLF